MKPAFWIARTPAIFRLLQRKDSAYFLWFPSRNVSHLHRDLPCHVQLPWLRTREFACDIAFRPHWGIRIVRRTLVGRIPYTPFSRNATFFALKVCSVCNLAGNVKNHKILAPTAAEERKNTFKFHSFWQGNSPARWKTLTWLQKGRCTLPQNHQLSKKWSTWDADKQLRRHQPWILSRQFTCDISLLPDWGIRTVCRTILLDMEQNCTLHFWSSPQKP